MKNIHVLPTDKPSILIKDIWKNTFSLVKDFDTNHTDFKAQHKYITSAEEIKVGDWYYLPRTNSVHKCIEDPTELNLEIRLGVAKIILTTDQDLIKDGVQAIDDEFLEWFVKKPSCEEVVVIYEPKNFFDVKKGWEYKIIIPKEEQKQHIIDMMKSDEELGLYEEPKQETLEEVAEREASLFYEKGSLDWNKYRQVFIEGAEWQQEQIGKSEFLQKLRATLSDAEARRIIRTT